MPMVVARRVEGATSAETHLKRWGTAYVAQDAVIGRMPVSRLAYRSGTAGQAARRGREIA